MEQLEVFLRVCLLGFALILTIVALLSVPRARGLRLYLVFGAFAVFLVEGVLLVVGIFSQSVESFAGVKMLVLLNLIAVILFYGSVAK
jgi:uncharacterized membrane protein YhfC